MPRPSLHPVRTLPLLTALAILVGVLAGATAAPVAAAEPVESEGYLELSDGTGLRYTLVLPPGDGPFPTVLQHSGYNPGNDAYDRSFGILGPELLSRGIAIIGVNLRGSGCSEGTFEPFSLTWGADGAEVVDWIADQPWSDGTVAMSGSSYPAIMSYVTAAERPAALKAIAPIVPLADLYRDVAYPGGIFNASFAEAWTVIQKYGTLFAQQEIAEGDTRCAAAIPTQNDPTDLTGVQAATNPYIDSLDRYTGFLSPEVISRIDVPVLTQTAWQDEQLGSRPLYALEDLDPDRTWVVATNGTHGGFTSNPWFSDLVVDFLEHFLRGGTAEDFAVPPVHVAREVRDDESFTDLVTYDEWPPPTEVRTLHAQPDGTLGLDAPTAEAALDYRHPQPAPGWFVHISEPRVHDEMYEAPIPPGGSVSFTTPPLAEDLEVLGPASLDLWLSSTAEDTDLQVSLVEVRPDGNELFVQRGWLRASHRTEVEGLSTPTRPWNPHTEASVTPLVPGEVTPMRVEVWPVGHVFRAGSSLRLYVEAPVGFTGFRQLAIEPTPAVNTVHVGPDTPTRLVFHRVPGGVAPAPEHAACDSLANQPCRPSPEPQPEGSLSFAGSGDEAAVPSGTPAAEAGGGGGALPATGGGAALLGLASVGGAASLHRRRR